jgi:hypothetical protein
VPDARMREIEFRDTRSGIRSQHRGGHTPLS